MNNAIRRHTIWISLIPLLSCAQLADKTGGTDGAPYPPNWGRRKIVPFRKLQKDFKNPDLIYAPFMFWFWDEPLDSAKMAEMSLTLCGQGFSPGYAHARMSMVGTPSLPDSQWLGDPWFSAFGAALEQAEARRNYLGYCDEYWWPSLQARGRVLKDHPELRAESVRWEVMDVPAGAEVRVPASFFTVAARTDSAGSAGFREERRVTLGKCIWHPDGTESAHVCGFRKTFTIPATRGWIRATAEIMVDDAYALTLNGKKVCKGSIYNKTDTVDVTSALVTGSNTIAVEGRNDRGAFGLVFGMLVEFDDGGLLRIDSDKTWLTSLNGPEERGLSAFGTGGWVPAREIPGDDGPPWNRKIDLPLVAPRMIQSGSLRLAGTGSPFNWKAPADGAWRLYIFNTFSHGGADGGQVNYIDSRLAPAFIETALEPYARRLGRRLGRSIPGDFIDNEGDYGWSIPWSATLDARYRERYGSDLRLAIPLLLDRDTEGVYAKTRWEWFDLVSDIYAETFQTVTDWHEKRGMYTTAHFWEEGIQPQVSAVGDHMKMLRALTMPAQDCLGRKALRVHDFKEIESVAEFEDARAATELMGAGGFEGTPWGTFNPPFLKQAVNAVIAWGMSHIIPHGVFTTRKLTGNPWPPDWYAENPMYPYLHLWTDFARRASYINSMGRAAPNVLLYNPIESGWILADGYLLDVDLWAFPEDRPEGRRINAIDRVYAQAMSDLTDARVEFLVCDRYYMKQMEVKEGRLARGEFAFGALVLPPLDILTLGTAAKMLDFSRAGGRIYALGELPSASAENGMGDPRMKSLMDALRGQPTFTQCREGAGLKPLLDGMDAPGLASPVRFGSGGFPMLQHRRRIDGRDFFWLVNNTDQWREAELEFPELHGAASIWDCETGNVRPAASVDADGGSLVTLVFKPYEAFWLSFDPREKPHRGRPDRLPKTEVVALVDGLWTVRYDATIQPEMEYPSVPPEEFANGTEKPLEDWRAWGLDKFSGLLEYSHSTAIANVDGRIMLDLGRVCHAAEVWVNGKSCGARLWGPHGFEVSGALRRGRNEIRVRVANGIGNSYGEYSESGLLGPVRLVRMLRPTN